MRAGVQGSGIRGEGLELRVQGLGFGPVGGPEAVPGVGFTVWVCVLRAREEFRV